MRKAKVLMGLFLYVAALTPCLHSKTAPPIKAIRFGSLVDGSGKVLKNATIIVEGDRIKSVNLGRSAIPPGAEVIELTRYTAIPGLIDAHTHMTYYWDQAPGPVRGLNQARGCPR
jgi:imidazolonepropionase-like amidohydrolase